MWAWRFLALGLAWTAISSAVGNDMLMGDALAETRSALAALPRVDREEIAEQLEAPVIGRRPVKSAMVLLSTDTSPGAAMAAVKASLRALPVGVRQKIAARIARVRHGLLGCAPG